MDEWIKKTDWSGPKGLTIDYKLLGTINIDELVHAIWEDIQIAKQTYGIRYVNGFALLLPVCDEYGELIKVRHPAGPVIHRLHTSHYRPACKDYEL